MKAPWSRRRALSVLAVIPAVAALLPGPAGADPVPGTAARSHTVVGRLVSFDAKAWVLKVRLPTGAESSSPVDHGVRVVSGGRTIRLADVSVGTNLQLTCRDDAGGGHQVTRVRVLKSKPGR